MVVFSHSSILKTVCNNCNAFVPPGFANPTTCRTAMGRIYELWLFLLHASTARIPACSWCGWGPTGHALLTLLSLQHQYHNRMPGLRYLNKGEKLELPFHGEFMGDLSRGIAWDLTVQGASHECSGQVRVWEENNRWEMNLTGKDVTF